MSVESTRRTMDQYFQAGHAASVLADDVVFTLIGTGEQYSTPQGVQQMLHYFYAVAFDATSETVSLVYGDDHAALEAFFVGKHIGDFAGIPATGNEVRIPLTVFYDLENDQIKRARVHLDMMTMMTQLGVGAASSA
jgi:steroid delta-isomerase-like uncharacterized protein